MKQRKIHIIKYGRTLCSYDSWPYEKTTDYMTLGAYKQLEKVVDWTTSVRYQFCSNCERALRKEAK